MDLYQLRIVRELSELDSLSAVAARLSVTTSAVSQQLRGLQDEIGEQLVVKSGRNLVLNEAGRVLAAAAVQVLASMSDAEQSVQRHFSDGRGEVTVAALHSAALAIFPKLLGRMDAESGPRVICSDTDVTVDTFARLVADVDLVIAHRLPWGNPWPASIAVTPLVFEPLDVAMHSGHRLAGATEVQPVDLVNEEWISVQESFPLASALHALGAAAGATLRVRHRLNEFPIVVSLVAAGQGAALTQPLPIGPHLGQHREPVRLRSRIRRPATTTLAKVRHLTIPFHRVTAPATNALLPGHGSAKPLATVNPVATQVTEALT